MLSKTKTTEKPWSLPAKEVFSTLKTSEKGLSDVQVKERLKIHGKNDIKSGNQKNALKIFVSQFTSPLILLLLGAATISYFLGENVDANVIIAIVFLSAVLGFFQEYKAEQALRKLMELVTVKTKVMRAGRVVEIDAKDIVPGDIVHLNIGDMIPADIRLFRIDDFSTNESSLTGESVPVTKNTDVISDKLHAPQDLSNMAFMGTSVSSGVGEGVVVAVSSKTFFGMTAESLKQKAPETEFEHGIRDFGNLLMKITFAMTLFILITNAVLGKSFFDSLIFAIALAVGITPEVLPILITITLSQGALKMAKSKVITKTLASVEDLGNMDILCSDKTGTLTEGKLSLVRYENLKGETDDTLLVYGLLCNSSQAGKDKWSLSNITDQAIWDSTFTPPLKHRLKDFKTLDTNEFDFERRRMSVIVKGPYGNMFIAKGAPESILESCTVDKKEKENILDKVMKYEQQGYRVIAVAEKKFTKSDSSKEDEKGLTFVGFLLFLDPPKQSAKESLQSLQRLGIDIKILSGDSAMVTQKICNEVGLKINENRVITGEDIERMHLHEFEKAIHQYNVFARISPEQKYRIVENLNKRGHVVGFLGDGINDAPALKAADVGISVDSAAGIAKEAADIILLKKSLSVLADGIVEGRKIFGNITKYILNTISANFGNMFTVAAASVFLKFIPLLPSQILLNNFISDFPLLTIAGDNVDEELVKKPKKWNIKLISKFMIHFGLLSTFFDLALILPLFFLMKATPDLFRTAWFVESALSEIIITFAIRTKLPFFKSRPSKWLTISSLATIVLTVGITYTAFGASFFQFVKMPMNVLLFVAGILIAYFLSAEIAKRSFFKKYEL